MNAVCTRPVKPTDGRACLKSPPVKSRITCLTRTRLRRRCCISHVSIPQAYRHLPLWLLAPAANCVDPRPKMGRQRVAIGVEPIAGEERQTPRSSWLVQRVDQQVRHGVSARTHLEHRNACGERIKGDPEPKHLRVARASGCAPHPAGHVGSPDGRRCAGGGSLACAPARTSHRVMVACRCPKTRSAADRSSPSASARSHQRHLL
jgi:hypothetical protein